MKIKQYHCSFGIGFKEAFGKMSGMTHVSPHPPDKLIDLYEPLILVGCYNEHHYNIIRSHRSLVVVYWAGSDANLFLKGWGYDNFWAMMLRHNKNARHIASSSYIYDTLKSFDIPNVYRINATTKDHSDIKPYPLGNSIFMYCPKNKTYNGGIYEDIKKRLPYGFIEAQNASTFDRATLLEAYRNCFIGLRFTEHDGLSCTAIELGLMGRKIIHNGDLPNCIPYDKNNIDDIVNKIYFEYAKKELTDFNKVAQDVEDFLIVPDWMDADFYEYAHII